MKELIEIQKELKVSKSQKNTFGNYNYRSLEDINEAVKPIANAHGCTVTYTDELVQIGERYYIKATATLDNGKESVSCIGWARESLTKKGMDESQITGTASSYARKYAAGGLFALDDTKDADTDEFHTQKTKKDLRDDILEMARKKGYTGTEIHEMFGLEGSSPLSKFQEVHDKVAKLTPKEI